MKRTLLVLAAMAFATGSAPPARAAVTFTDLGAGMTGLETGTTAWGDYDNDGDLDVFEVGAYNNSGGNLARVYRNDAGTFTITSALPASVLGAEVLALGDYDRDGDLDLAIAGWVSGTYFTRIYANSAGVFTDIGAGLEGASGALAWGDYDNDGDLDLAVSGYNGSVITRVYRNDTGNFVDAGLGLPGRRLPMVSWADVDNDRDLDLLLSGYDADFTKYTTLYLNNGGVLSSTASGVTPVFSGSHDWGDFDNDGDLDLLISGDTKTQIWANTAGAFSNSGYSLQWLESSSCVWGDYDNDGRPDLANGGGTGSLPFCAVYHNDGAGFSNINAPVPGMQKASLAWGDYDNDGDLDLLLAGGDQMGGTYHRIYRSTGVAVVNTPPSAPTNLFVTADATNVTFHWSASTDAQGGSAGLSYNLWAGYYPGTPNVMPPMANLANGFRRVARVGNVGKSLQWTLKRSAFAGGAVYWGVQAIDQAFAGSPFANGPSGVLEVGDSPVPAPLTLRLAGSNPCRGDARIAYALPRAGSVDLAILDISGRRVQTLARGEHDPGEHEVRWDRDPADGSRAAPGLYVARLSAGGEAVSIKIVSVP